MTKKILIFNGHARASYRWGMFGETVLRLLEDENNEVYYMDCNGAVKTPCGFNAKKHIGYCNKCNKPCLKLLKHIKFDENHILKMKKYPKVKFAQLNNIKDAIDYEYDGYNYGLAPVSTIMTLTRDYDFDIKKWQKKLHAFFQTEYVVFKNLEYFHKIYNFDEIHTFNGRVPVMYPCVEFAKKNNLKFVLREGGAKINHLRTVENDFVHSFDFWKEEIKQYWQKNDPNREELAQKWFEDRRKGAFQAMESFTKDQKKGSLPKNWDENRENIVFFNSSIDEVYAFDCWKHPFVDTENEIIEAMLERYKDDENKHFYLRIHPNLTVAKKKKSTQIRQINEFKKKYKNLTIIEPDEKIDTYALMDACDKVLTTYSTVGIEATYWGNLSIIAGKAPYEDLDCVYQANSMEEFFKLIDDKNLTPKKRENTYPYGYRAEVYGDKYKYYTLESRKKGNFLGMELKSK